MQDLSGRTELTKFETFNDSSYIENNSQANKTESRSIVDESREINEMTKKYFSYEDLISEKELRQAIYDFLTYLINEKNHNFNPLQEIDYYFWKRIIDSIATEKEMDILLEALILYLDTNNSEKEISSLLDLFIKLSYQGDSSVLLKLFGRSHIWIQEYAKFSIEHPTYLNSTLNLLCDYITHIDRHHTEDIIAIARLQELCVNPDNFALYHDYLKELIYLQLTGVSYNIDMLDSYFQQSSVMISHSCIFAVETMHYFMLYVYKIPSSKESRERMAVNYICDFISCHYLQNTNNKNIAKKRIIKLCGLAANLFPSLRQQLIQVLNDKRKELDERYGSVSPSELYDSMSLFDTAIMQKATSIKKAINGSQIFHVPDYFTDGIGYLVEYLKSKDPNSNSFLKLLSIFDDYLDKDYGILSYEESQKPEIAAKVLLSVLRNEISRFNSSEENMALKFQDNESIEYQIEVLTEFQTSFLCKMMFDPSSDFQVRQFLISHFKILFSLSLKKSNETLNFMSECYIILLEIISNPIEPLSVEQTEMLQEIIKRRSLIEAFDSLKFHNIINQAQNSINSTFFANLPFKYSAITVMGGSILINARYKAQNEFNDCALKVIFIHELAHYVRKINDGLYDIYRKTPEYNELGDLYKGISGSKKNKILKNKDREEGGWLLENKMFNCSLLKVTKEQISFLNKLNNWDVPLKKFTEKMKSFYIESAFKYDLTRSSNGHYHLERQGHNLW